MSSEYATVRMRNSPSIVALAARRPLWLAFIFLALGASQVLAFAPFGYWYVFFPATAVLLWAFEFLPRHRGRLCAYWYGVGFWLATTHWIYYSFTHFVTAPFWMVATLVGGFALAMALFWVLLYELWYRFSRPFGFYGYLPVPLWLKALLFAGCWVTIEWVRSTVFQGFPWLLAGYSLVDVAMIPFAAWLPIGGVWSLSFILVLLLSSGFYLLCALLQQTGSLASRLGRFTSLLLLLLVPLGACWLLPNNFSQPSGETLRLGLVQPSIPLKEKWSSAFTTRNLLILQQLTEPLSEEVDVVLWPESAVAGAWQDYSQLLEAISNSAAPAALVSGSLRYSDNQQKVHNSIVDFSALGAAGSTLDEPLVYDKRQLVPFGEFMPLYNQLSQVLRRLGFPASNLAPAQSRRGTFTLGNMLFAASICYEVIFPRLLTPIAWQTQAILNISDDGWFGDSIGPAQHFLMARTRAIENARQLVRVGNDGVTALIDHKGRVKASLPRFARDTLYVTIEGRTGRTPFSFIGDWIVLLLAGIPFCIYVLLLFFFRVRIE